VNAAIGRRSVLAVLAVGAMATLSLTTTMPGAQAAKASSQVYVVQGVPGVSVDVSIDGKSVAQGAEPKAVVGPVDLVPGTHHVSFSSPDWSVGSTINVDNASQDVVLHWPAQLTAEPEVTVFANNVNAVASGKGRVTVAHTAVVPPADIRANNDVLFSNIANGEFVSAVVPATTYSVAVVPTGQPGPALLGPVDLPIKAGALTRVFAIGQPENGSMDAVVQVLPVANSGSGAPGSVDAGEAGLVDPARLDGGSILLLPAIGAGLAALVTLTVIATRRRHARP
jgi:hypothetical protein